MENEIIEKIKNKWKAIKNLSTEDRSFLLDSRLKEIMNLINELTNSAQNKDDIDKYAKIYSELVTTLDREVRYARFDYKLSTKKKASNQDYLKYRASLKKALFQIKMELADIIN